VTNEQLSIQFFLQLAIIIATCRLVGRAAQRWLGQPQVVGEMIAGVLLGPSVLGLLFPQVEALLFPPESKQVLYVGAQLGVGLYMFIVGLTFDREDFRNQARAASALAFGSMAAPFAVAALMTPWLMGVPGLFAPQVESWQAALFLGAAIAITAFPMLARIIHEAGIAKSPVGTLSLSSGAIGDAGAWVVVAVVIASLGGDSMLAWKALGGGTLFALVMIFIAPRFLARLAAVHERQGMTMGLLGTVLVLFLICAFLMEGAGIHVVFGGFLLGAAMPRGRFADDLRARIEPFATVFLLPMFFTFSGLNTQLQVVDNVELLAAALAILAASFLAKGGACYAVARLFGHDHATAMSVAALMNARGLMELIIINIGLQRGIIEPGLFAILVVMAIVTTLAASPMFEAVRKKEAL
jgi:Kef-type K+ transport system membrane component KefB